MKLFKRSGLISGLIIGLVGLSLLTACGARRSTSTTAPQPAAPQATAVPAATTAPQPTRAQQATTAPTVAPTTQAATAVPPTVAPTQTSAPTATAVSQPDTSGDALDQLLQKLDQANSSGDSLNDVPELK